MVFAHCRWACLPCDALQACTPYAAIHLRWSRERLPWVLLKILRLAASESSTAQSVFFFRNELKAAQGIQEGF